MTSEEAVSLLMNISAYDIDNKRGMQKQEALKMAIKALEQEHCDNAISKASVFEIMGNLMSIPYDFDRWITEKDVSESMDEIRDLPSVAPIRKKGKWVKVTNGRGGHECNICHAYAPSYQNGDEHLSEFCPNCGAKMEVEE